MDLNYALGATVVVTIFKKHKVGKVVERAISLNNIVHNVEMEDGKLYEGVSVMGDSDIYINTVMTKVFNNK
jgi:hypothetical protein|tara:strand:+ start:1123 stop:1335 length:213 start_codon:yes stop_codon:yes gene_type:complete